MGYAEEKKTQKRLSLMDAAFRLFTTQGIGRTSIEDIAKAAGVAKGTFYLYFKDKNDLHQVLVQKKSEQLLRHALDYSGYREKSTAEEKLISIIDDMLLQLQDNHRLLMFFNKNLSWNVFRKVAERVREEYRQAFEEIFGKDSAEDADIRIELYTILEFICATCHSVILEGEPVDLNTYRPYLYRSIQAIMGSFQAAKTSILEVI